MREGSQIRVAHRRVAAPELRSKAGYAGRRAAWVLAQAARLRTVAMEWRRHQAGRFGRRSHAGPAAVYLLRPPKRSVLHAASANDVPASLYCVLASPLSRVRPDPGCSGPSCETAGCAWRNASLVLCAGRIPPPASLHRLIAGVFQANAWIQPFEMHGTLLLIAPEGKTKTRRNQCYFVENLLESEEYCGTSRKNRAQLSAIVPLRLNFA